MSYSQILRRLNRILKSRINDVVDSFSKEDQDLHDFDEELRNAERGEAGEEQSRQDTSGDRHSGSGGEQRRQRSHKEGKHKPGEKDDVYYFGVLGLTPDATEAEIKKAYRNLMRQYHPDRVATLGPDLQAAASKKSMEINEAYHIIERRRGFK
ncbi:J domain-containing protein [bacterium]|nr:J domain-containing protein [bacterium]